MNDIVYNIYISNRIFILKICVSGESNPDRLLGRQPC